MKHGKRNDGSGTGLHWGPVTGPETIQGTVEPDRQESCSGTVGEVLRQTTTLQG